MKKEHISEPIFYVKRQKYTVTARLMKNETRFIPQKRGN